MSVELFDDLEAGELSVEFEGQEPWELLEWAIEHFGRGLALSTAFQEGDVALIDMAYRIDPSVRVFSIDTGRLPQETHDLVEELRERYPGLELDLLSPDAGQVERLVKRHGPNGFRASVENRLLCCNVRKVQPLTRALAGLDAWVTGLRREQSDQRAEVPFSAVDDQGHRHAEERDAVGVVDRAVERVEHPAPTPAARHRPGRRRGVLARFLGEDPVVRVARPDRPDHRLLAQVVRLGHDVLRALVADPLEPLVAIHHEPTGLIGQRQRERQVVGFRRPHGRPHSTASGRTVEPSKAVSPENEIVRPGSMAGLVMNAESGPRPGFAAS